MDVLVYLRYNNAGCAALKKCITDMVVPNPRPYATNAAVKYGFLNPLLLLIGTDVDVTATADDFDDDAGVEPREAW